MALALKEVEKAKREFEGEVIRPTFPSVAGGRPSNQAYRILQIGFTAAPILAGADKFTNKLVDWEQYLARVVPDTLGVSPRSFMRVVGAIEVAAGVGVAVRPKLFGYVVSAWLLGIVGNLLFTRKYYDIALRDFGLSLGALALGRLAQQR